LEEEPKQAISTLDLEIQAIEEELREIKFESNLKEEEGRVRILTTKVTDNNNKNLLEKRNIHSSLEIPENNKYQL
jgi:hypothetical protein